MSSGQDRPKTHGYLTYSRDDKLPSPIHQVVQWNGTEGIKHCSHVLQNQNANLPTFKRLGGLCTYLVGKNNRGFHFT